MFSKADKSSARAAASGEAGGGDRAGGIPSIISPDLKIVGNLTSSGDIQLDGTVEGDVNSRSLTIGEGALVRGALSAESIRVYGAVAGTITANTVVLASSAKVDGDISHRSLSMEAGASLAGQISRLEKPIGGQPTGIKTAPANSDSGAPKGRVGDTATLKPYGA